MKKYDGNFNGELKIEPIKFSKVITKTVTKNNKTSGKINLPLDLIDQEVIVLIPKEKTKRNKK